MSQVGARYATPRFVSLGGRRFRVMWCGPGVIVYKEIGSKKKQKKEKKKKKKADGKKKSQGKCSQEDQSPRRAAKTGAKKTALKKGGKQVIKGVGKKAVLKGAAKKLIPGAAYVEAAAVAAALLAGAKPAFGGEGMSAEEALLEIAKTGTPPDVEMSDELQELLKANPDVLERLRAVAGGEATSDEAAQAMIDMLEANMDLLDAETLEGIAKMAELSGDPRLAKTAAEVRKTLEAIRAGKEPTAGVGEGEAEAETEAEAEEEAKPEGEAKAEAGEGGPAGKAASRRDTSGRLQEGAEGQRAALKSLRRGARPDEEGGLRGDRRGAVPQGGGGAVRGADQANPRRGGEAADGRGGGDRAEAEGARRASSSSRRSSRRARS